MLSIKKKLLTPLLILGTFISYAQSSFEYSYDATGNRIQRKVITLNPTREGADELIKDQDAEYTFNIYPNPTQGKLAIELEDAFLERKNKEVFVYDLQGIIIDQFPIIKNTIPIDLSNQKAGMYIVKIHAGSYSKEWKIVKL